MTPAALPSSGPWTALCYHDVRPDADSRGGGPERFSVPLESFERMLDAIIASGRQGCSLEAALRGDWRAPIAITFDDAIVGQYVHAVPALLARKMSATIYVCIDWIGRPGYMTWAQLREVSRLGISIQSHSWTHPFFSECDAAVLRHELADSNKRVEDEIGLAVTEIAFPGGDPPRRALRHLIAEAGYGVAVGTRWGVNTGVSGGGRFIRRCTVRGALTPGLAQRHVDADRLLAWREYPREAVLRTIRSALGPSRYARWRRVLLDVKRSRRPHVLPPRADA